MPPHLPALVPKTVLFWGADPAFHIAHFPIATFSHPVEFVLRVWSPIATLLVPVVLA